MTPEPTEEEVESLREFRKGGPARVSRRQGHSAGEGQ